MSLNRSPILVVCLAAALLLSGCAGQQLDEEQEQRVAEQFEQQISELDGYHANVTMSVTLNNQTRETKTEIWARTDTGEMRQEVLAPPERAGSRTVSNGSVMWTYDAARERATRIDVPDMTNNAMVPDVGTLVENYDIYSNGTVDLDSTQTHKLTLVPNESAEMAVGGTITMWVDTQKMFPVKMSMDIAGTTSTVRYTNLTLNPDFEPGTFEFEPPEGVEVREPSVPDFTNYESYEELTGATNLTLPAAELPQNFTFESGSVVDSNRTNSATLQYSNGTTTLSAVVSTDTGRPSDLGENVSVGNRTGTYTEFGERGSLSWECAGSSYTLGGKLDKDTLVGIATALDC